MATINDRHYIPIKQEPYCCVPTCILMVMQRHGLALISQVEIGKVLGLVRPPEERPSSGYGTQIQKPEYDPNVAFRKLGIPLSFLYIPIFSLENSTTFSETVQKALSANQDVLICYHEEKINGGHLILAAGFDEKNLSIFDPQDGLQKVYPTSYLYERCVIHGDRHMAGLWVITVIS